MILLKLKNTIKVIFASFSAFSHINTGCGQSRFPYFQNRKIARNEIRTDQTDVENGRNLTLTQPTLAALCIARRRIFFVFWVVPSGRVFGRLRIGFGEQNERGLGFRNSVRTR